MSKLLTRFSSIFLVLTIIVVYIVASYFILTKQFKKIQKLEFNEQKPNHNSIININNGLVNLTNVELKIPCFISKDYHCQLEISNLADIDNTILHPLIIQDNIDILIIGTGNKTCFLAPQQQVNINNIGVGLESMNNAAACRSFNLLLSDFRAVGLLLLN